MKKLQSEFKISYDQTLPDGAIEYIQKDMAVQLGELLIKENMVDIKRTTAQEEFRREIQPVSTFRMVGFYLNEKQMIEINHSLNDLIRTTNNESIIFKAEKLGTLIFKNTGIKTRPPEFENCGHCGALNCRNNETCKLCDKLRTWIP